MSLSEKDLKALLVLNRMNAGGLPAGVMDFLREDLPAPELVRKIQEENFLEKREELEKTLRSFSPDNELEKAHEGEIRILTFWDEDYPAALKNIPHAPAVLYVAGTLIPEDGAALAIVGSRYPSIYGISQTRRFSSVLASAGLTIISGMAQGIDLAAHEGVLNVPYGRTIGVLGCGLDVDYPRHRRKIQEKILACGAIISEYPFGTPPLPENFPKRNRIIAGLALGVFVAEAHERSGSLITARQALDQGKEVFALPGPVDRVTSRGAHRLIKEGACLAESPEDILENLKASLESSTFFQAPAEENNEEEMLPSIDLEDSHEPEIKVYAGESELLVLEKEIIGLLKSKNGLCADEISAGLQKPLEWLMPALTLMELKRMIRKSREGKYDVS